MSIAVHYVDIPRDAQSNLWTEGENLGRSQLQKLPFGGTEQNWASLEMGGWPLDGTRSLPRTEEPPALMSKTASGGDSGALGAGKLGELTVKKEIYRLSPAPAVVLYLKEETAANGLSFWFSDAADTWCSRMELTWYRGELPLETEEVFPDGPYWTLHKRVEGFDRVRIVFLEMNRPGVLLKMRKIQLGRTLVFQREHIRSVRLVNDADPTLSRLSVDTMTVELFNLEGVEIQPREQQQMELYRDGKLVACQGIRSYSRTGQDGYTFSCQSLIGKLEETFLGGIYQGMDAEKLLTKVVSGWELELDPLLKAQKITGYLPVCTRREALQQIAFAIGGVVSTRGSRGIRIQAIPTLVTGHFPLQAVFEGGEVKTEPKPGRVEVVAHSYTPAEEYEVLMDEEQMDDSDLLLTFSQPYHSYEITGGTLLESGANFVRIRGEGPVKLRAKPYQHTQLRCIRYAQGENVDQTQVEKVEEATLVHSGNAPQIADRLLKISAMHQTLRQEVVAQDQYAGQKVALGTAWGDHMQGYITAMQSVYTQGGHVAEITVSGCLQQPEKSLLYAGDIWSGSWEVMW